MKGVCKKYRYFECYSAYVQFQYGNKNETCLYATAKDSRSENASINSVNSRPIGSEMTMLKERDTSSEECIDRPEGMKSWTEGAFLLSACVVVLILWIYLGNSTKNESRRQGAAHDAAPVPTVEMI